MTASAPHAPEPDSPSAPPQPLKGVRVVELARVLAGPWAGQCFADLGAEVIKIEHPNGDETRSWGPPFIGAEGGRGDAAYFHACNRGKLSIALDFERDDERRIARDLAARADVLIENFLPGKLARFGLDYASLSRLNPQLIHCSITGFGQTGPYADSPGYDYLIQAMSGIMDLTGEPDGEPQKIGVAFADLFTALYAVIAVQAALRERRRSGKGAWIDMALFDCQLGVSANQALNYFASGTPPRRLGNAHPNIVPYQSFAVADGGIVVAVGNDRQFARLCAALGREEWARDPRFIDNAARVARREALTSLLAARLAGFKRDDILKILRSQGVPAAPIHRLDEAFADPQARHRRMRVPRRHADRRGVDALRTPILIDGVAPLSDRPPPALDADRDAVLALLRRK